MLERGALWWDIASILYVAGDNNTAAMRKDAVLGVKGCWWGSLDWPVRVSTRLRKADNPS